MARSVTVKMLADVSQYVSSVKRAGLATRDFAGEMDKAAKNNKLDHVTRTAAGLGVGLLGVAGTAVKFSMDFEKAMSAVSAATHGSVGEIAQLRAAAIKAGQDTQFSATEAAQGITELSKAGVHTADILNGGLKGALDLAAAGQIGVAEAAETSATALTQFKLSGAQVPHVADLLAAAAGKAQGSVHDVGAALNQSGLVASQFGLSIEDTTGALAEFANAGLIGSDAGTSFKTMLLAMANPSDITKAKMKDLGLSFYDVQGNFRGVAGVAAELQDKLKDLTEEERNAALGQIFGNDAIRAASILYTDGAVGVQKWAKAVSDSGYAQETAAKLTDNLAGDLERLRGSLETVAIQSGGGATDGLRSLAQGANAAVNAFSGLPHGVQEAVTVLSGVGGVSLLAAAGFLKARGTVTDFMTELRNMGPVGTRAADGLGKIGSIAGKLGLAGAAAVGLYQGFKLFGEWIDHFTAPVTRDVNAMGHSLQDFAQNGRVAGELAKTFGTNLRGLQKDIDTVSNAQQRLAKVSSYAQSVYAGRGAGAAPNAADRAKLEQQIAQAKVNINALDTALANLVNSGNATAAKVAFNDFAAKTGLTIRDLKQYPEAAAAASQANSGLAKGFGTASSNAKTLTNTLQAAIEAGQTLTDVWNQLHGAVVGTDRAMLSANEAVDAVKASFKENKNAIEGNSTAALKNRVAVAGAAEAAAKAAQAKYEETGSVNAANTVYSSYIGQLRKTLIQSGLTKKEADRLLASYASMPPSVGTTIKQPGMPSAQANTKDLWNKLKGIDGNWVANLSVKGYAGVANDLRHLLAAQQALKDNTSFNEANRELGHFFIGRAGGGPVVGPGSGTSDSIPARLSNGEYVIKAASVAKIGVGRLNYANRFGELPAYAGGGLVNMPFPTNVKGTKIPEVALPGPGGRTSDWIVRVVHAAFPGLAVYSKDRPGARTLTGNTSYHALGRAVDFAPSRALAEWVNAHYFARTRELITPWQSLNIHNGARHAYSPLIYRQHSGSNAHDHWAMADGGVIREPVFGVGASGDTYSLGEGYRPETVTPGVNAGGNTYQINVSPTATAHPADIGREVVAAIKEFERGSGTRWRNG